MMCPDCEANLDEVPVDAPCPSCGGVRRSAVVELTAALGVGVAIRASASVGYNPVRPWQQKWRDIEGGLVVLEDFYARDDANNEDARRAVEDFFKDCRELADWLKADAGRPEAMAFVNTDPALQVCDGMAQTVKHHTRQGSNPVTARVAWVHGGGGVRVEIEWSRPSSASRTEDALDLARRCVAAWRKFFQQYSLDPTA